MPYKYTWKSFYCPVCKDHLGRARSTQINEFTCESCQTYFTFYPRIKKPTAELMKHRCNCANCTSRHQALTGESEV